MLKFKPNLSVAASGMVCKHTSISSGLDKTNFKTTVWLISEQKRTSQLGVVAQAHNPSTGEAAAKEPSVPRQSELRSKFEVSMGCSRTFSTTTHGFP